VYGYLMIVGVNTGFHGAPVFRVRSARLPGLGHYSRVARSRDNR
jgi:NAD(P)H-hydrate repair Nnr-like enzyme with NAD(P)H-hydrate dehydratase domain